MEVREWAIIVAAQMLQSISGSRNATIRIPANLGPLVHRQRTPLQAVKVYSGRMKPSPLVRKEPTQSWLGLCAGSQSDRNDRGHQHFRRWRPAALAGKQAEEKTDWQAGLYRCATCLHQPATTWKKRWKLQCSCELQISYFKKVHLLSQCVTCCQQTAPGGQSKTED